MIICQDGTHRPQKVLCDGCHREAPVEYKPSPGLSFLKLPPSWYSRADGAQHACSAECVRKIGRE